MGTMSDFFKRGFLFDNASGLKTGANLEDLVTRATPVAGTQLVDQVSLTDAADASVVDDAGVAVRRLQVKDGGITLVKLADGVLRGTKLDLSGLTVVSDGLTGISDWSAMLDDDDGTATAEGSYTSVCHFYIDLGAVKHGYMKVLTSMKNNTAAGSVATTLWGYADATSITDWMSGATNFGNGLAGNHGFATVEGASYKYRSTIQPFYGRYVGMGFYSGYGAKLKMNRFDVYTF